MDVVARLQARSTGLRNDKVVSFSDTDMDGILPVRIAGIPLCEDRYDRTASRPCFHWSWSAATGTRPCPSPRVARTIGVYGSPCTALLKSFEGSGFAFRRPLIGSALKLRLPPVVWVPPFRNGIGVILIWSGIGKIVFPASGPLPPAGPEDCRRHDVDRVRHAVVQLHQQLTEARSPRSLPGSAVRMSANGPLGSARRSSGL